MLCTFHENQLPGGNIIWKESVLALKYKNWMISTDGSVECVGQVCAVTEYGI